MNLGLVVALVFFVFPILCGVASGFVSDLTERPTKTQISNWSATAAINKPNFKRSEVAVNKSTNFENLLEGETGAFNDLPDFEQLGYHEGTPHYNYDEIQHFSNNYDEVATVNIDYPGTEVELVENTTKFTHSIPSSDMASSIEELLARVETNDSNVLPFKSTDVPPEEEEEMKYEVLGENYDKVAEMFGPIVANMVTATPDCALEEGVPYVMIGKIQGKFLNCFGETIELQGLPKNYEAKDEFVLLHGNFVTADLFSMMEIMSAENASKGEEFEVLNVAFA